MRGINSLRNPMEMLEYRMVPLLMSVVKIGEELSISCTDKRTKLRYKTYNICKSVFIFLTCCVFCYVLPAGYALCFM